ncbi:MAG: ABC transporter ATP-binding protein [Actinomycetota bacterium]
MEKILVDVQHLNASYGQALAIRGIDLQLGADEIVAVLGHNGAGKSTLLRAIARTHRSVSGKVEVLGEPVVKMGPSQVARLGLSLVREGAPVFAHLTVEETLKLAGRLARSRKREPAPLAHVWDWFPALEVKRHQRAGVLSGGQRQMLGIAAALVSRPSVLLLDEPSAGLAPSMAESVFKAIEELCSSGMSVLLAEQDLHWVTAFAARAYVLETGRIVEEKCLRGSGH